MAKIGKRGKVPDGRPARARYWLKRSLEKNKIRNLMKHCGMSSEKAYVFWSKSRVGRVPLRFMKG